jgi:starch synthase
MAASENGALRGGKVGGVGDVIRDLPLALAEAGCRVSVITPSYGRFQQFPGAVRATTLQVDFGGRRRLARLFRLPGLDPRVEFLLIDHSILSSAGRGVIYCDDGPAAPFKTDSTRFAFFSAAVAACVEQAECPPHVLHLHDWHTGLVLALRRFDRDMKKLRSVRSVFTIHNLAFQGTRPLRNHAASFEAWFPHLKYRRQLVLDPRFEGCVNPMAVAIRTADRVSTVSPGYAREIQRPSDPARGFFGGEGLDADLREAAGAGRLTGILNGCTYPGSAGRRPGWPRLLEAIGRERSLLKGNPPARKNLGRLSRRRPANVLASVGRVTDQKVALFLEAVNGRASALESILGAGGTSAVFIMLGSGDPALERRLMDIAAGHDNFLFLRGYSESLSDLLYRAGDLFLMPSSFEPCGISQMLAMRAGQPCVVHAVGGLKDTVTDHLNGFTFGGSTPGEQAQNFVSAVRDALALRADAEGWQAVRENAAAARFSWAASARAYLSELYGFGD